MRENRPSGLEGGAGFIPRSYPYPNVFRTVRFNDPFAAKRAHPLPGRCSQIAVATGARLFYARRA